jgi:5-methylcytosine-specific restriction protein A
MGKLRSLAPAVGGLRPRISTHRDVQGHSREHEPLRREYSTARWERLRQRVFERDLYTCQCGCETLIQRTAERIADHVVEHKGDPALFWDEANVQTLWKPHHDGWKQRLERRRQGGG